jgi:hypothetical protein
LNPSSKGFRDIRISDPETISIQIEIKAILKQLQIYQADYFAATMFEVTPAVLVC